MGEGEAGTKGEGLEPTGGESASAAATGNALFRLPGTQQSGPAGLEATRAFLTTATVPLASRRGRAGTFEQKDFCGGRHRCEAPNVRLRLILFKIAAHIRFRVMWVRKLLCAGRAPTG